MKRRHREAAGAARASSLSTEPMVAVDDRPEAADYLLNDLVSVSVLTISIHRVRMVPGYRPKPSSCPVTEKMP